MMPLVLGAVFVGTLLLIVAAYAALNRDRIAAERAMRDRLLAVDAPPTTAAEAVSILRSARPASGFGLLNRLLEGRGFTAVMTTELERAGSRLSVGEFVMIVALALVVGALVGRRFSPTLGAAFGAAVGAALPFVQMARRQRARYAKFESQLPEAIDMLVNAMRAGYSLQAAMKFIADEMSPPLSVEFGRVYDQQRLGMDVRTALLNLQARVDTVDLKMFVTALLIQRESGGNLAEILTNLSTLMRERVTLRGSIDTLTAEPRMSGMVLTAIPVVMFLAIHLMNPEFVAPLYTTPLGRALLAYGAVSIGLGFVFLRRIGHIDI